MTRSPWRDDTATIPSPVCQARFTPTGRQHYCSASCRKTAWPRREFTVCQGPGCGERLHGQQRCPDCGTFTARLGPGGPCPHCGEPVTITDLLQEVVTTPGSR